MACKDKKRKQPSEGGDRYPVSDLFDIRDEWEGYYHYVGMRAVMLPLVGDGSMKQGRRLQSIREIRDRWHAVVGSLGKEGIIQEPLRLKLLHCPPVGFKAGGNGFRPQTCQQRRFCPFCWGRQAGATWSLVDNAMFPYDGTAKPETTPFDLVYSKRTVRLPQYHYDEAGRIVGDSVRLAYQLRQGLLYDPSWHIPVRLRELRQARFAGAFEIMSVDIDPETLERVVHINQLFAVAGDNPFLHTAPSFAYTEVRKQRPTRREVADTVAMLYRYPEQLLLNQPGEIWGHYLAGAAVRPLAHFGIFRKKKPVAVAGPKTGEA